jgi:hypothetical protein
MGKQGLGRGEPIGPLDWLRFVPHETAASSDRLEWVGLEAARCRATPAFELNLPALTHHRLFLFACPPEELDLQYEGVKRNVPPPAGSISLMPAGSRGWVRSSGCKEELHIFLEPGLVGRVAAEGFGLDPARLTLPPLDGLHLPQLRAAMLAVNDELMVDAAGGPLAAESLANVLAVRLIRNASSPRPPAQPCDGARPSQAVALGPRARLAGLSSMRPSSRPASVFPPLGCRTQAASVGSASACAWDLMALAMRWKKCWRSLRSSSGSSNSR